MGTFFKHYPQPVIIGTTLTGLLISIALSRARVSHVLIGKAPDDSLPRTGQILTPVATPTFTENFPELAHLGYPKKQRVVHMGDHYMQLDFSHFSIAPIFEMVNAIGGIQFTKPWNLDRVAADKALFEKAVNAPYCQHVDSHAVAVDYEQATDTIRSVTLADSQKVPTSHVYDASGTERFLGRQLGLFYRSLGRPQSIVHAIYRPTAESSEETLLPHEVPPADWYQHRASILRLYKEQVGINGMAACIPLGDHVSVHACSTLQDENTEQDPTVTANEQLIAIHKALAQVGADVQSHFPICTEQGTAIREQYVCDRAFGTNWLLTGRAYCDTLVTIAANTDHDFAAFYTGVPFLRHAATVGRMYKEYLDYSLIMQESWQWGSAHTQEEATKAQVQYYLNRYIWANQLQYFVFLQLKYFNSPLRSGWNLLHRLGDIKKLSHLSVGYATIERVS